MQHSKAKKIEHFLIGYDPERKEWIDLLCETFFEIFLHYNYQFLTLIKNPIDAWSKAMWKIAKDVVNRIFDALPSVEEEKSLTKDLLIRCFLQGKSDARPLKAVAKRHV